MLKFNFCFLNCTAKHEKCRQAASRERHEHRITRHEESITHTHTRTHVGTRMRCMLGKCVQKENAWTQATARYDGKSHVSCAKCRSKLKPDESAVIGASVVDIGIVSYWVIHEQEAILLSGAKLLRHTRRMRNVAGRTHWPSFFCVIVAESKSSLC